MTISIKDDDNGFAIPTVTLDRANGAIVSMWDPGFPEVREVIQPYVDASGVLDSSRFHNASQATLQGVILHEDALIRREVIEAITLHMRASSRSYIHWQLNDDPDSRCVQFRVGRFSRPVQYHNRISFNASLTIPKGIIESSALITTNVDPDILSDPPNSTDPVANNGTVTAWPIIQIDGPCTEPRVLNYTTGKEYQFVGLTIANGDYVLIDSVNRVIQDQDGITKLNLLRLDTSEWWGLEPGTNAISFQAATYSGVAAVTVAHRHAWI